METEGSYSNEYAEDAAASTKPTEDLLTQLLNLAHDQVRLENRVAAYEEKLAKEKKLLEVVSTQLLPMIMEKLGVAEFTFSDGAVIQVAEKTAASISEANREAAFAWLRENGHGDIIKHVISVSLKAGMDDFAKKLVAGLRATPELQDQKVDEKESIASQTLLAFVKTQIKKGQEVPDSITVMPLKFTKITVPEQKAPDQF